MRILDISPEPIHHIPCLNAASGGGRTQSSVIPVLRGRVDALPGGLDALVIASDLQGYASDALDHPEPMRRLLGIEVAVSLDALAADGAIPDPLHTGVLLAGDLYAIPNLSDRGGIGDVDGVWRAFAERFRWVVGVAGNHDLFSGRSDLGAALEDLPDAYPLHGDVVTLDELRIAGISGVMGNSSRPWRNRPRDFQALMRSVMGRPFPDVLVLHHGPSFPEQGRRGNDLVREELWRLKSPALVVHGHRHWDTPLAEMSNGVQALNVDFRVVVLTP